LTICSEIELSECFAKKATIIYHTLQLSFPKNFKPLNIFLDIYLMATLSSSAHANNLKLMKTPNPSSWAFLKMALTPENQKSNEARHVGLKTFF